jgi:hypothetical protein
VFGKVAKSYSKRTRHIRTRSDLLTGLYSTNHERSARVQPASERATPRACSHDLMLRERCKHSTKESQTRISHLNALAASYVLPASACKCLAKSTLAPKVTANDGVALQTTCEGTAGSGGSRTSHAAPGWGRANPHRTGEVMRTVVMQRLVARTHPASPRQFNSDTKPQCPGSTPRQPVATAKYSTLGSKLEL